MCVHMNPTCVYTLDFFPRGYTISFTIHINDRSGIRSSSCVTTTTTAPCILRTKRVMCSCRSKGLNRVTFATSRMILKSWRKRDEGTDPCSPEKNAGNFQKFFIKHTWRMVPKPVRLHSCGMRWMGPPRFWRSRIRCSFGLGRWTSNGWLSSTSKL